ncbi:MAG: type II secretion system F family protein [Armatimonadota bacterium]
MHSLKKKQKKEPAKKNKKVKKPLWERIPNFKKISPVTVSIFARQLAVLFRSGITMVRALKILHDQAEDKRFKEILGEIYVDICKGHTLAYAFGRHLEAFPIHYVAMIHAGETSGDLVRILNKIARDMEKEVQLGKKIKSAMVYPFFVVLSSVASIIFMIKYIIPLFIPMFDQAKKTLPLPTQFLIYLSKTSNNLKGIIIILVSMIIIFLITRAYLKTKHGRLVSSIILLNLPVIGKTVKMICIIRFCRTFSMLYASGVPLIQNLKTSKGVIGNEFLSDELDKVMENVHAVDSFTMAFEQSRIFPKIIIGMLSVGESSGKVAEILTKISNFYDEEIEHTLNSLVGIIEPILIIFLGGVTSLIMISVLLPLYNVLFSFG